MSNENPHTPVGIEELVRVLTAMSHKMEKGAEFYGKSAVYADQSKKVLIEQAMQCCFDISTKVDEINIAFTLLRNLQAEINGK